MDVTVVTPTLPERSHLLADCMASVATQTVQPASHLIAVDYDRSGPAAMRNQLIEGVETEWLAFLDDDDVIDPCHLDVLSSVQATDVIIPHCRFDGEPLPSRYCNRDFDLSAMRRHGIFPITVMARTEAIRQAGCFNPSDRYEDWSLWNRMADLDATFSVVPVVTWTYRTSTPDRRTVAA